MASIREKMKEWIKANKQEEDMTAESLERLYKVMTEMEECLNNPDIADVPVEQIEKWFSYLQFSIVKELTGKEGVILVKEEEISNAIEKRFITEGNQSKHSD